MMRINTELLNKLCDWFLFDKSKDVKFIMRHGIDKKLRDMCIFDMNSLSLKALELLLDKL